MAKLQKKKVNFFGARFRLVFFIIREREVRLWVQFDLMLTVMRLSLA